MDGSLGQQLDLLGPACVGDRSSGNVRKVEETIVQTF
jgi:hypothetical protein